MKEMQKTYKITVVTGFEVSYPQFEAMDMLLEAQLFKSDTVIKSNCFKITTITVSFELCHPHTSPYYKTLKNRQRLLIFLFTCIIVLGAVRPTSIIRKRFYPRK